MSKKIDEGYETPDEDRDVPESLYINSIVKIQSCIRRYLYPIEIENYFNNLKKAIKILFNKKSDKLNENEFDILDHVTPELIQHLEIELKIKQRQMNYGKIWEKAIGLFPGWEDLGTGHETECDVRKIDNTVICELKNKYNTCNSGSKKDVERKLSNYKMKNPDTMCIWGIINEKKSNKVHKKKYIVNNVEIIKWQGKDFLTFIFTYKGINYSNIIINFLKNYISKC